MNFFFNRKSTESKPADPGGDEPDQEQILDKTGYKSTLERQPGSRSDLQNFTYFFPAIFSKCGLGSDLFKITDPDPNTTAGSGFAALSVMRPTHLANSEPCNFSSSAQSL